MVDALVEACNRAGGIDGRTIELRRYDGSAEEAEGLMGRACGDEVFFLVGSAFGADGTQEATRLGCDLPAVPALTVDAAVANAALLVAPVPEPADRASVADAILLVRRADERAELRRPGLDRVPARR